MDAQEDCVPCEDFPTCGAAQFQNRQFPKNIKQQDSYFVVEDIGTTFGVHLGRRGRVSLYGVSDGHGEFGEMSAGFIRRNLPPQLAQSPHFAAGRSGEAFHDAFAQTEMLQQSSGLRLWASGACVLAVAVSSTHIVVANCGDCRCVLADRGTAKDLSNDHNVESASPEEIQRVLKSGGTIGPDKRVTVAGAPGRLATTRSLGDYWAKPQGPQEGHVISGLPEIRTVPRQPGQQFLIIASDGIFGFMSSQEVVTLLYNAARQAAPSAPLPLSRLAHTIICTAVNNRRSDDNCTCLVVDLARIEASEDLAASRTQSPIPGKGLPPNIIPLGYVQPPFDQLNGGYPQQPPMEVLAVACPGCGDTFAQDAAFCRRCGQKRPEVPMQCPTCGCIYSSDASFCKQCGTKRIGGLLPPAGSPVPGSPMNFGGFRGGEGNYDDAPKDDSDVSLSSLVAPDEICWCPFCWHQNRDGEPENVVLGSFEKWRQHMHEQHFDKLGKHYAADEIMPCYWCCRPCVTKKGQNKSGNCLAFWGSHERVCRENPNKPTAFGNSRGARAEMAESNHSSSGARSDIRAEGHDVREMRELRAFQGSLGRWRSRADEHDSPQSHQPRSPPSPMVDGFRTPQPRYGGGRQRDEGGGRQRDEVCICGNAFMPDAEFCRKCGAKRPLAPTKVRPPPEASHLDHRRNSRVGRSTKNYLETSKDHRGPASSIGCRTPARRAL